MLRYDHIPKELIMSRSARQVYRTASVFSLALFAVMVADPILSGHGFDSPQVLSAIRTLVLFGIVGATGSLVAMECFFFAFDDSTSLPSKILWFVVLAWIPVGPPLYCFFVYSRSKYFQQDEHERATRVSA